MAKNAPNSISAGALPQTLLGENLFAKSNSKFSLPAGSGAKPQLKLNLVHF